MSGTPSGNLKAAATKKIKYGDDYHAKNGSIGGKAKVPKGFAVSGLQSEAGRIGGAKSRKKGPNKSVSQWTRSIKIT
jgi:hypothetical protein